MLISTVQTGGGEGNKGYACNDRGGVFNSYFSKNVNRSIPMKPPFEMIVKTDMERYRYNTWDSKEPETIAWIDSFKDGEAFFDIGANVGVYSLYCASQHPGSQVYAFEPMPKNFIRLLHNVELNGFTNLHCFNYAIDHWTHLDNIYVPRNAVGESGTQIQEAKGEDGKDFKPQAEYLVQHLTLQAVVSLLKSPKDYHVKIDVDGHERSVLQGMKGLIKNRQPKSILVEFNDRGTSSAYSALLIRSGYTVDNDFNLHSDHSRVRRKAEGITAENVIFNRSNGI